MIKTGALSVVYKGDDGRDVHALRDVNLEIAQGERVAIIGHSGSGKSTLLRVLAGLIAPTDGSAHVLEQTIQSPMPRAFYERVGVVFQDYGLVRQLTPLQNVLCGGLGRYASNKVFGFTNDDKTKAMGFLKRLGVAERAHVLSARLSGGERQRVGIARVLLQNPEVMLLDEPVASLDVHWTEEALKSIDEVRDGQTAAVVVMHDLELVRRWA